jgi:hypothetical protein
MDTEAKEELRIKEEEGQRSTPNVQHRMPNNAALQSATMARGEDAAQRRGHTVPDFLGVLIHLFC